MPRLFTGLEVPGDVALRLSLLRGGVSGARWIEPDDYHLTLSFIGNVDVGAERSLIWELARINVPEAAVRLVQRARQRAAALILLRLRILWADLRVRAPSPSKDNPSSFHADSWAGTDDHSGEGRSLMAGRGLSSATSLQKQACGPPCASCRGSRRQRHFPML